MKATNTIRHITKTDSVICLVSAMLFVACANGGNGTYSAEPVKSTTGDSRAQPDTPVRAGSRPDTTPAPEKEASPIPAEVSSELRFDFTERIALSHLRSSGLLIDFGHVSRNKHTIGDWKTGWRGNYVKDGVTWSYLESSAARVFFFLDENEAGDGRLVIRARGIGQKSKGRLYLNGEGLGPFEFGPGFSHVAVDIKGLLKAGNNELLLRPGNGAKAEDGKFARLAVDYIRVIPAGTDESQAASAATAVIDGDEGGASRAIRLRGGDRLTWYVPVPEAAFIRALVRSTGEGRESDLSLGLYKSGTLLSELFNGKVDHRGIDIGAPLSACADDICAVDVRVNSGEVLFETLQMRVPLTEPPKASGKHAAQNVVLLLIDTLRADKLVSFNRDSRVQTPFLDALAKESMIFENAWAQENWTKPSITSLLSGLYSATHQNKSENNKVPSSVVMMQEHFSKLGFETAGFVANGYVSDKFGFKRGWDTWTNYVREGKRNRAQFVADDAVNWLKKRREEKPFFLYIHTIDPHVPYIPPAKYRAIYDNEPYSGVVTATETAKLLEKVKTGALKLSERDRFRLEALYDGEISYHDDHLVRVYDELKEQGLLENTVLIVTADHGEEFFDHGSVGHGHSLYEELLHVPLIIRLPGARQTVSGGARFREMVELVDVFPTLCELTGIECPRGVQGSGLLSRLNGRIPAWPAVSFSEFMDGQLAARTSRYKLIYRGLSTTLFDLKNDPGETADLSVEQPEAFIMMRDVLGLHMGRFAPLGDIAASSKLTGTKTSAPHPEPAAVHKKENATIDAETRKQLEALGYMGD